MINRQESMERGQSGAAASSSCLNNETKTLHEGNLLDEWWHEWWRKWWVDGKPTPALGLITAAAHDQRWKQKEANNGTQQDASANYHGKKTIEPPTPVPPCAGVDDSEEFCPRRIPYSPNMECPTPRITNVRRAIMTGSLPGAYRVAEGPSQDFGITVSTPACQVSVPTKNPDMISAKQIVIEESDEYNPDLKPSLFRRRRVRLFAIVGIIMLVILVVGISLGLVVPNDNEASSQLNSSFPEWAHEYLEELSNVSEQIYSLGTSHNLAAEWIIQQDARNLTADASNLIQRYVLAFLYYSTTSNRQSTWKSCNPPGPGEDDMCTFQYWEDTDSNGQYVYRPIEGQIRWLSPNHECEWAGIGCDAELLINRIELWGHNMTGTIPSELEHLSHLETVSLPFNLFQGTFPSEALGKIEHLQMLDLQCNQLTGMISDSFWEASTGLESLLLGANQLSGTLSSMIGRLTNLAELLLHNNSFAGSIPTELTQLTEMREMWIDHCHFSGTISSEIGRLAHLKVLRLDGNELVGTIPTEIGLLTNCYDLRLAGTENLPMGLSGTIPEELYNMTSLQTLILHNNDLSGTLSMRIGNLSRLHHLSVIKNNLMGSVPSELAQLTELRMAWLQFNQFTGSIPVELCNNVGPGKLEFLHADCGPEENPAQECDCCSSCCDRDTEQCELQS